MSQFKVVMPKTTAGFINCFPLINFVFMFI